MEEKIVAASHVTLIFLICLGAVLLIGIYVTQERISAEKKLDSFATPGVVRLISPEARYMKSNNWFLVIVTAKNVEHVEGKVLSYVPILSVHDYALNSDDLFLPLLKGESYSRILGSELGAIYIPGTFGTNYFPITQLQEKYAHISFWETACIDQIKNEGLIGNANKLSVSFSQLAQKCGKQYLTSAELKLSLYSANSCSDCGRGTFCIKEECEVISTIANKQCTFTEQGQLKKISSILQGGQKITQTSDAAAYGTCTG